jgi:hypothetical protein
MAAGGSLREAAAFLGINDRYDQPTIASTFATTACSTDEAGPAEFKIAIHALARQLNSTPNLIDYQHRRHALRTWHLDTATWQDLLGRLPPTKGPFRPELGDCKRQFASEAIWTRITQGEHTLAPRIIEDQLADTDPTWARRRDNMWHFFDAGTDPPVRHYVELKKILHAHADTLATAIDAEHSPEPLALKLSAVGR